MFTDTLLLQSWPASELHLLHLVVRNTHTSHPPPLPLAPIPLICSRSIIIILLLINHRDSKGATLHLSTGTPRFPSSLPPFHREPPSFALSLSVRLPLGSVHGSSSALENINCGLVHPPPPPRVCFFSLLLIGMSITAQQQAHPRSNSRPLVNQTTTACTTGG